MDVVHIFTPPLPVTTAKRKISTTVKLTILQFPEVIRLTHCVERLLSVLESKKVITLPSDKRCEYHIGYYGESIEIQKKR